MSVIKPVIKWSGSKRSQAEEIIKYIPRNIDTYYEPFIGGGSVLYLLNPNKAICGDICKPLIDLWLKIQNSPEELFKDYELRWNKLKEIGEEFYYQIRKEFNKNQSPNDFLFLSRTCVNGLIRFNSKGEFNSPFHLNRDGIEPTTLRNIIYDWSFRLKNVKFLNADYTVTTVSATDKDLVYLDPPYMNTKGMYMNGLDYDKFLNYLENLNCRGIKFLLSFDGICGDENNIVDLPKALYKRHLLLNSGNSSFRRIMGNKNEVVQESLYLNF